MPRFASILISPLLIASTFALGTTADLSAQPPEDTTPQITIAPAGVRRFVSGKWATVAVNGLNRSEVDAEETVAVIIGDDSSQQFARRIWIPARSRRQSWMPILIPGEIDREELQVPMTSIHLKESSSGEQYQASVVGMTTSQRSLLLSWEESRTAIMFDQLNQDLSRETVIDTLTDTVYAGRDSVVHSGQDLGLVRLGSRFLPPSAKALDALDQIVIGGDLILQDTVAVARIRDWLMSGGRLWIMVDQVDEESVRALLGDVVCYSEMNRVELNDFELQQVPEHSTAPPFDSDDWTSETPVDFVRVMIDTDDVHSYVDGWPAAFWWQVGNGEVLFTTLGARGWMQDDKPIPSFARLSDRLFQPRLEPPRYTQNMIPFLNDEIGYNIPSRSVVASILGLHMLVVLAAGAWLASRQRLQQLALVIPVAALLAAGSLVTIGTQQTSAVPSTIATGQIARAIPDSAEVQVESIAAIYSQQERDLKIESSPETTTQLRDSDASSEIRRLLWDDRGDSNWLFVKQPPGVVRHVESESLISVNRPWNVHGKFTEQGFQGRINGLDASRCEDAVIVATAVPTLAANLQPDASGKFVSGIDDVLAPDQFIDEKLMSDTQQDRQALIRRLNSLERPFFSAEPTLLVWTDPIDSGVEFNDGFVRRGSTMALLPIRLQRLRSGSKFQVPASFIRLSAKSSLVFNATTGRWLKEMNRPITSELACVIPKALLPCNLSRAIVVIKINAPSRSLDIKCMVDGEYMTMHSTQNPTGQLRFEIDQADALQLNANGELPLMISVTPTAEELAEAQNPVDRGEEKKLNRSIWEIDYVHVHVEGTTL
jgi:hypothetical protein